MIQAGYQFCSDASFHTEPLGGTAVSAATYVFISWPKSKWGKAQYDSIGFPSLLREFCSDLQKNKKVLTRLYHKADAEEGYCDVIVQPGNARRHRVPVNDAPVAISELLVEAVQAPDNSQLVFFFCTHGVRDRCCAKYGFAAVQELRKLEKEHENSFDIYETTHLGGDRFAGTALVFPHGHMYGRLRAGDAARLVAAESQGVPYAPNYRGCIFLEGAAQAAEAWGYLYAHNNGQYGVVRIVHTSVIDDNNADVQIDFSNANNQCMTLRLVWQSFEIFSDCQQMDEGGRKVIQRWVVDE